MSSPAGQARRSIFSFQRFRQYYVGQTLSLLGDGFRLLAMPLLNFRSSHSAISTALAYMCELPPFALLIVVGVSIAERLHRRAVNDVSNAVRCAVLLLLMKWNVNRAGRTGGALAGRNLSHGLVSSERADARAPLRSNRLRGDEPVMPAGRPAVRQDRRPLRGGVRGACARTRA